MKEYQFQYTYLRDTIFLVLSPFPVFILMAMLAFYLKLGFLVEMVASVVIAFFLFKSIKRKVIRECTAKGESSLVLDFENNTKLIDFKSLTSFKTYSGNNGPILYLNSEEEKFSISANNNFVTLRGCKYFATTPSFSLINLRPIITQR